MRILERKPIRVALAASALLLAYLGLLAAHGWQAEPDLVVLYRAGPHAAPPKHHETGLLAWASPKALEAEVERFREARGKRETVLLDAAPTHTRVRRLELKEGQILLAELAEGGMPELLSALRAAPSDLVVVATCLPVDRVLAALPPATAVLPGCYGPSVPGEVQVDGRGTLVAPWVDSRWRLGALQVILDPDPSLRAQSTTLRLESATATSPTLLGHGGQQLTQDLIHFGQEGLAGIIAARIQDLTQAELVLINYLSVRKGLVGPVTTRELEAALPFHNEVVLLTMDAEDLLDELAHNEAKDTRYLTVAGAHKELGGGWLLEDGRILEPGLSLRVATVDYLADGGRGKRPGFTRGRERVNTGLFTDRLALDLLEPLEVP